MRILIYGGTFDPIHHGHLILARDAMERLQADRLLLIPAAVSPHKLHRQPSPAAARRAMLAAAIAGEPGFVLDDRELDREGPSYTFDTVAELKRENPEAELLYLVGGDNLAALHTWYRYAELRQLVRFVTLRRSAAEESGEPSVMDRQLDVSSTEIRERVARGLSIRYLVPEPVRVIIEQNHLYRRSPACA